MSSMLDALGMPGGAPPPGGPPMGPDPSALGGDPASPDAAGGDVSDILRQIVDLTQQYIASPDSDDIETAKATKILVAAQELLASEQKAMDSAMGTKPEHKALAKAAQGIAGGGY